MTQKIFAVLAVALVLAAGVGGAVFLMNDNGKDGSDSDTPAPEPPTPVPPSPAVPMKDAAGRDVKVPDNLDNGIVTVGSLGPMRYVSVFGVFDKIVETDKSDVEDDKNGRGYSYAYDFTDKDIRTHEDNQITDKFAESLGTTKPSLIIMQKNLYEKYPVAKKIADSFNVLVIYNQTWTDFFDEEYKVSELYRNNINLIGKALKMEDRAEQHLNDLQAVFDDMRRLVGENPGSTYIAGVTKGGSNQWDTTFPYYMPLSLTGGINAYTGPSTDPKVTLEIEEVKMYLNSCDRIIIDPSSSDKMNESNSQLVMKAINDINKERDADHQLRLYVTYPIVWDHLNYDTVLASAYYLLHLQYGTLTLDEVKEKIDHVFEVYYGPLGANVPTGMSDFFEKKSGTYGEELPLLSEVKIVKNGDKYVTVAA